MSDNKVSQEEELEALSAIYGDDWKAEVDDGSYSIQILPDIKLFITLNADYPSDKPPSYQLLAPTLKKNQKDQIRTEFEDIYRNSLGGPVLFEWVEKLKEITESTKDISVGSEINEAPSVETNDYIKQDDKAISYNIIHGSVIQDRKSTFQAHTCMVENMDEVKKVLEVLHENKKIAQATHNILAYRICLKNGVLLQDYDDDGESHAGGRLLHLLQILDVNNVMVVVSRWYGGIHLGPDRFRHINNAARQVLQQAGFIKDKTLPQLKSNNNG